MIPGPDGPNTEPPLCSKAQYRSRVRKTLPFHLTVPTALAGRGAVPKLWKKLANRAQLSRPVAGKVGIERRLLHEKAQSV